jgi:hypothetical protein
MLIPALTGKDTIPEGADGGQPAVICKWAPGTGNVCISPSEMTSKLILAIPIILKMGIYLKCLHLTIGNDK